MRLPRTVRRAPAWAPPRASFDAIATCFFLDCFPPDQLREIVACLAAAAAPDALWLNVDFAAPPRGLLRWRALAIHHLMYAFFGAVTALPAHWLTPPDPILGTHGFVLAERAEWEWGLIRADCWTRGTFPGRWPLPVPRLAHGITRASAGLRASASSLSPGGARRPNAHSARVVG